MTINDLVKESHRQLNTSPWFRERLTVEYGCSHEDGTDEWTFMFVGDTPDDRAPSGGVRLRVNDKFAQESVQYAIGEILNELRYAYGDEWAQRLEPASKPEYDGPIMGVAGRRYRGRLTGVVPEHNWELRVRSAHEDVGELMTCYTTYQCADCGAVFHQHDKQEFKPLDTTEANSAAGNCVPKTKRPSINISLTGVEKTMRQLEVIERIAKDAEEKAATFNRVVSKQQETPMPEFKDGDRVRRKQCEAAGTVIVGSLPDGTTRVKFDRGDEGWVATDSLTHVTERKHSDNVSERGHSPQSQRTVTASDCNTCRHDPGQGNVCKPYIAGTCVGENSWAGYEPQFKVGDRVSVVVFEGERTGKIAEHDKEWGGAKEERWWVDWDDGSRPGGGYWCLANMMSPLPGSTYCEYTEDPDAVPPTRATGALELSMVCPTCPLSASDTCTNCPDRPGYARSTYQPGVALETVAQRYEPVGEYDESLTTEWPVPCGSVKEMDHCAAEFQRCKDNTAQYWKDNPPEKPDPPTPPMLRDWQHLSRGL
jgi:hypothetical protein